ncbi:uncharacterized protein EI90DRAFT_3023133 [Cantharellus anzutake]|uniref:uncharacterized protein n=1 Tax=Cantharellus anzutake TaxID=1750568 RepID=UPI001903EB2C|nr:uncharacterized protein EI90DRAFT_3023133 [Cantharellus anzutake]KAF8312305.1 hypothetical protein EI90DRAFT_3023133 [Cantharellus anzutake]
MSWGITKQSILVLPYQILHPEMHRRLSKSNISNCKWTMETPSPGEQVVTVAIESFSNNVFINWLAGVANNGRLGCIMFDEAHGIVEDQLFHPAYLDAVRKLMQLQNAPILFMSGTMSRGFTWKFWKAADLLYRPDQSAVVIRTRTQRPQIFYQFVVLGMGQEPCKTDLPDVKTAWNMEWRAQTVEVIRQVEEGLKGDERGLVFFAGYYGFDYHAVAFSIFVGQPFSVNDFYQSSGRVARGLQVGTSLVLLPAPPKRFSATQECFEGRVAMTKAIQQYTMCHRVMPSLHLDSKGENCMGLRESEPGTVLCVACYKDKKGKLDDYDFDLRWGKPFDIDATAWILDTFFHRSIGWHFKEWAFGLGDQRFAPAVQIQRFFCRPHSSGKMSPGTQGQGWQQYQEGYHKWKWKRGLFCTKGDGKDIEGYCWKCLLNMDSSLVHTCPTKDGCKFPDMIPEMAWMVLGSEALRKGLANYIGDPKVETICGYESWLLGRWEGNKKWRNSSTLLVLFFYRCCSSK